MRGNDRSATSPATGGSNVSDQSKLTVRNRCILYAHEFVMGTPAVEQLRVPLGTRSTAQLSLGPLAKGSVMQIPIVALGALALLALSVCGCGSKDNGSEVNGANGTGA